MTIVERVRNALNITTSAFDGELRDVVEAARADMILSGVPPRVARDDSNPDVVQAIKCYVKSDQAWETPEIAARQAASYDAIVNKLSLTYDREKGAVNGDC